MERIGTCTRSCTGLMSSRAEKASARAFVNRGASTNAGKLLWLFPAMVLCSTLMAGAARATDYCVSASSGSDSNSGLCSTSSPWQTIGTVVSMESRFQPGDNIQFLGGDVWNEELTLNNVHGSSAAGGRITFTSYGTRQPVIDGCPSTGCSSNGPSISACIAADQSSGTGNNVSYITVKGFECRNTSEYGINFRVENAAMPMRGIRIENNYVHNTGPGAFVGNTSKQGPYDDGNYANQLNAEDDTAGQSGGDSFKIVNNIVNHCGGHNCLQVHYDTGAPLVQGNRVGPGCVHNCIDTKGVGNGLTSPAPLVGKILDNYVTCPGCSNSTAAYYTENNYNPSEQITYQNNIAYHAPIAFQAETGGSCSASACAIDAQYYNNTAYQLSQFAFIDSSCTNHTLDIEKNIINTSAVDIQTGSCALVRWSDNDDVPGSLSGVPSIAINDINNDPLFCGTTVNNFANVSDFSPMDSTVSSYGANNKVTSKSYLGAVAGGGPCANVSDFSSMDSTASGYGANDSVTSKSYLGAVTGARPRHRRARIAGYPGNPGERHPASIDHDAAARPIQGRGRRSRSGNRSALSPLAAQ